MGMKRIIIHWTAGTNQPNGTDFLHYHYVVNGDGVVVAGKFRPEDNLNCNDGKYAQHTGGGNTGSIGVAMCGMYVPNKTPIQETKYPLTAKQVEATFKLCAELCKKYNIPVTPQTVMTHYEFGKANPKTSSAGKIDIIYLHPYKHIQRDDMGNFIRAKIRWYLSKL
jgi:N-acetyl-anhydromuramyl-L-alanine amidase AmpD